MKGLKMKYFVLKPESKFPGDVYAKASRHAMMKYAEVIQVENRELSAAIAAWVVEEDVKAEKLKESEDVIGYPRIKEE